MWLAGASVAGGRHHHKLRGWRRARPPDRPPHDVTGLHSLFDSVMTGAAAGAKEAAARRPYACYIHGNNDTTGALRSIQTVTTGLRWDLAQAPLEVIGAPTKTDLEAAWELGAAMSARLTLDPA